MEDLGVNPGQDYSDPPGHDGMSAEENIMATSGDKKISLSHKHETVLNNVGTHGSLKTAEDVRRKLGAKSSGLSQGSNNGSSANIKKDMPMANISIKNQRNVAANNVDSIVAQGHAWT